MNTAPQSNLFGNNRLKRTTLTFSVEGLTAREELLFKGYVRLLDHMTEHCWQYHEASALRRVDLLVADEQVQPTRFFQIADKLQPVLQLGVSKDVSQHFFLAWPLKPYELENELNRLGRLIGADAAHEQFEEAQKSAPASAHAEPTQKRYRLRRWPKSSLLAEPGSIRLATLLTGKAIGIDELVFRSALPKAVCERFVATMQTADLIMLPNVGSSQPALWTAPAIAKPGLPAQHERHLNQPAVKAIAQPGLLARIRLRFGIKA